MPKRKRSLEDGFIPLGASIIPFLKEDYQTAIKLQNETNSIPITYIGGNNLDEVREQFWKQEPVLQHAIDSVADVYGVPADIVKYRINHEGFTDHYIQNRNDAVLQGRINRLPRGYKILNDLVGLKAGISDFGFDDYGTYLKDGKIKLKGTQLYETLEGVKRMPPQYYSDYGFINENGRQTNPATGWDNATNFGMVAAGLRYFKDKAREDFPNASDEELNRYSLAYFNRGEVGGKRWVKNGAKGYNYKRSLKAAGGSIHIAPSKRGTFTATATKHGMSVQEFAARVLRNKEDYSPSLVKKANFARNASKWNH